MANAHKDYHRGGGMLHEDIPMDTPLHKMDTVPCNDGYI
jgi:hypothetical protein